MKLRAIRCAEFRRFSDPVTVEGIGERLNILAGDNERGKSTLFDALDCVFKLSHRVTGKNVERMRPQRGGDPLIEIEFEAAGKVWRLRKRFGRKPQATLLDVNANRIAASADDVDPAVAALVVPSAPHMLERSLNLVWVRQKASLDVPTLKSAGDADPIKSAAEAEMKAAAVGIAFERVQSRVAERLAAAVTGARRAPKAGSAYAAAIAKRDDIAARLADARVYAETQSSRTAELAKALESLDQRDDANRNAAPVDLAALQSRLASAREARHALSLSRERLKALTIEISATETTAAGLAAKTAECDALKKDAKVAESLDGAVKARVAELNAIPVTPAAVQALRDLTHKIDVLAARLDADAVRVDIVPVAGAESRIRVGTEPLGARREFFITDEAEITIDEIARIRITAANADATRKFAAEKVALEVKLQSALGAVNCATIAAAEAALANRTALATDLDAIRDQLKTLAPRGIAALNASIATLEQSCRDLAKSQLSEAALGQKKAEADAGRADLERLAMASLADDAFRELERTVQDVSQRAATEDARRERLQQTILRLEAELTGADGDNRAGQVTALGEALARADAEVTAHQQDVEALQLLAAALQSAAATTTANLEQPLKVRLQPLMARVFGNAEAEMKPGFNVDALARDGVSESVPSLSDGTREQISVLVRIAFADLLQASGVALPLVLDDPLVYSDDTRLSALSSVFAERSGQTVVMTCRATAFRQALVQDRATWLAIKAWQVADLPS